MFALRKLVQIIPFLLGLTLLSFLLGLAAPGDPALAVLTMDGATEPTAAELAAMRHQLGLDLPVWEQYGRWLAAAVQGNLGLSYLTQKPVLSELLARFPVTMNLSLWSLGWIVLLGIPVGVWAAKFENSCQEMTLRVLCLFFISVPAFWLGILCMLLFSEVLQVLPSSGYGSVRQILLPSFVLAAGTMAATIRLQTASLHEVLQKGFVLSERAKGLPRDFIIWKHVFPNALLPVLTMLGNFFGSILGGSVIIEDMFSIPGLGSYVLAAIWGRDYPVIQGYVILSGTIFLLFNYLVDLSYYVLNPAIRKER